MNHQNQTFEPGDLVYASVPCGDGRGFGRRVGIVVGSMGNEPVAVMGTPCDSSSRSGFGRLVLAPVGTGDDDAGWCLTQLTEPVMFDGAGELLPLANAQEAVLCGTIREFRAGCGRREWLKAFKGVRNAAINALIDRMRSVERFARAA